MQKKEMNSFASKLFHSIFFVVLYSSFADARSCPWPCVPEVNCRNIDLSVCLYGSAIDTCLCCTVCGLGPGALCGKVEGNCGDGLTCVQTIPADLLPFLSERRRAEYPGHCENASSEETATREETTTEGELKEITTALPTTATTTTTTAKIASTTILPPPQCKVECSVEACAGTGSRNKICSARGMAFSQVRGRDDCQHTSCRACFLHYSAVNCSSFTCPDPPNKRCLSRYSNCINDHYHSIPLVSGADLLEVPPFGVIKCFVPEMTMT